MASKNDKWLFFKNYLHNELGITKEDIREWLEDAVKQEAKNLINQSFKQFDLEKIARGIVRDEINCLYKDYNLREKVYKKVIDSIKIEVPDKLS